MGSVIPESSGELGLDASVPESQKSGMETCSEVAAISWKALIINSR